MLATKLSVICTPRILLFRLEIQSTYMQIKYKPPIVTTRLKRSSYFVVYIFQSLFIFFNICTKIFTLSISPRSCRDSISFAYSCFIPESLLYCHWVTPKNRPFSSCNFFGFVDFNFLFESISLANI